MNCKSRRTARGLSLAFSFFGRGVREPGRAQNAPVVTGVSPASVAAGGPTFTVAVTGSGFLTNSVVQINGSNRPTTFKSSLQLTATIFASDIATPATLQITVFNPLAAGGGLTSNAVALT